MLCSHDNDRIAVRSLHTSHLVDAGMYVLDHPDETSVEPVHHRPRITPSTTSRVCAPAFGAMRLDPHTTSRLRTATGATMTTHPMGWSSMVTYW